FYPPESAARYAADDQEILRRKEPLVNREEPIVDRASNERWYTTTKVPLRDGRGEVTGLVGISRDITERKRTEEALAERVRRASLAAEVGVALTQGDSLRAILQRCAEALVKHLDCAFARIWTLHEEANELHLLASAGLYTHIDGPHGRIPVGQFKIGQIAQER